MCCVSLGFSFPGANFVPLRRSGLLGQPCLAVSRALTDEPLFQAGESLLGMTFSFTIADSCLHLES